MNEIAGGANLNFENQMASRWTTLGLGAALWVASCTPFLAASDAVDPSPPAMEGTAVAGQALFTGARRFNKGGPACVSCHTVAGLAFPNGGSLGPDLTGTYDKLGDVGLEVTVQTLYFPTMVPIFNNRLPTLQEQADLKAFFIDRQSSPPPKDNTLTLVGLALMGCLILLGATWGAGRSRLPTCPPIAVKNKPSPGEKPA